MKKWVRDTIGGIVLAVVSGVTIFVATQEDFDPGEEAGKLEVQYVVDVGTKASLTAGHIIQARPIGFNWGRCDNPETQADVDYCKALGSGALPTVESLPVTDAEANSINAKTATYKVDDLADPTTIILVP